jgi:LysR family transcriptional regulator, transcription activator of glutamate synthase operon
MDVRQLRYFEAVARHRHFTHAADELHIAQSALSHQVGKLERELGIELLQRTTRSVHPTEAGELVVARARAVLAETEALRSEIDELRGLVRGHVTVGAMLFGGELDIPAILASFTSTFPDVEIGLREGTAQRMIGMLADGSLDIAFALEIEPPDGTNRLELSNEELAVAMSPGHPLEGDGPLSVEALADSRLVGFQLGSSTRRLVDAALAEAAIQPRIALESNDFALVRALVAQGIGLAILPRSFLERPGPTISFRTLSPALRMRVVLWWRSGRRLSPAARAFVDFVAAYRPPPRRQAASASGSSTSAPAASA